MATKSPIPSIPKLQAIAIAYRNQALIADQVLPYVPVDSDPFEYLIYNKAERFTIPDTHVGRRGQPNQVEFGATESQASTQDNGLDASVPQTDIDRAGAVGMDPVSDAVEGIMDLVTLAREARVAGTVFNTATYPAGNQVTLAGTDLWSDFTDSDPIADIQAGLDTPIARPNMMVLGNAVASILRRNPKIVKSFNGTSGDAGIVPLAFLQDLFEVKVLVGQGFLNSAKPGQAANFSRVWGKDCALLYQNQNPAPKRGVTFGFTARFGPRVAGAIQDPDIGLRGGTRVRAGESVVELITASDVGYLIHNAIS